MAASNIVDGREIVMKPASEWDYDGANRSLTTTMGKGHFRLTVSGDRMEGEISLADGKGYRRIHLVKRGERGNECHNCRRKM